MAVLVPPTVHWLERFYMQKYTSYKLLRLLSGTRRLSAIRVLHMHASSCNIFSKYVASCAHAPYTRGHICAFVITVDLGFVTHRMFCTMHVLD